MLVKESPSASPPLKEEESKFIETAELDVEQDAVSVPSPPINVSLPEPPSRVSSPEPPSRVLFPEFPVRVLSNVLPVASISPEPVRVNFSTLLEVVKVTED